MMRRIVFPLKSVSPCAARSVGAAIPKVIIASKQNRKLSSVRIFFICRASAILHMNLGIQYRHYRRTEIHSDRIDVHGGYLAAKIEGEIGQPDNPVNDRIDMRRSLGRFF